MAHRRLSPALQSRVEPRLQIGEDRIERGAQRDQKALRAFAIAAAADIAFPETRDDAPQIVAKAADVAAVAQILRPAALV